MLENMRKAVLCTLMLLPHPVFADDGLGMDATYCAQLSEGFRQNQDETKLLFMTWTSGYLTAVNAGLVSNGRAPYAFDHQTVKNAWLYISDYCAKHPSAIFSKAASDYLISVSHGARP